MRIPEQCKCDLCGNDIKTGEHRGTLMLPRATVTPERVRDAESDIMAYYKRSFLGLMARAGREQMTLDVCMGCVFGLLSASTLTLTQRKRLLEHVTDRAPENAYATDDAADDCLTDAFLRRHGLRVGVRPEDDEEND